jgi:hypothetical protein
MSIERARQCICAPHPCCGNYPKKSRRSGAWKIAGPANQYRSHAMKKSTWMLCILLVFAGCYFEERVPIEMVSMNQTQPLKEEKSLESTIRFDIGSMEITGSEEGSSLYSMHLEYDKNSYEPEIQYESALGGTEGRFTFNLESTHKRGIRRQRQNNRLRLAFADSVPLELNVTAGVGDARLSLSGMKVAGIDFESGVGSAKISAYEPNLIPCEYIRLKNGVGSIDAVGLGNLNFRELDFEGGVGRANLDFTGEWKKDADIHIEVGVGGVNIRMPREIGVRMEAEKHFLSGLQLEGFNQKDSVYYSENYDSASIKVSMHVTTGIGGLKITWV